MSLLDVFVTAFQMNSKILLCTDQDVNIERQRIQIFLTERVTGGILTDIIYIMQQEEEKKTGKSISLFVCISEKL